MKHRAFKFSDNIFNLLRSTQFDHGKEIDYLISKLNSNSPSMITRFGSVELQTICLIRYWPYLNFLKRRTFRLIGNNAGFFPVTYENLKRFYNIYKADSTIIDTVITWRIEEFLIADWLKNRHFISKETFDGFYEQEHPWTSALRGKRILVVHPFAETIESQYVNNRSRLFTNPEVLPEFASLQTIKAVQSIAGNSVGFDSWFDALDWMKNKINKCNFDIALLGCGAYAMPLAAHIKRMGKKAVHMGGILQFLFGIKSIRYEENPDTAQYINDYFVYPSEADKPKNADLVEGGCYWGK